MKDEIKEILDRLKYTVIKHSFLDMSLSEYNTILDYITNLEQENERLLREKIQKELCESLLDECDEHNKYLQDRIDKAIEYIKELCYIESRNEWFNYGDDLTPKYIVDILTGGDEE